MHPMMMFPQAANDEDDNYHACHYHDCLHCTGFGTCDDEFVDDHISYNDNDGDIDYHNDHMMIIINMTQILPSPGFGTQSAYCTGFFPSPCNSSFYPLFNIYSLSRYPIFHIHT